MSRDVHNPETRQHDIEALREAGHHPYPERFETTYPNLGDIDKGTGPEDDSVLEKPLSVAGRVVAARHFGKLSFCHIQDATGSVQIKVDVDGVGKDEHKFFKKMLKVGDHIGVSGTTTRTNTGEFTVAAQSVSYLGLALRPLPEKWHGLKDRESRYRQRYLDMIANEKSRDVFISRSKLISAMRRYFEDHGFFEVETPILTNYKSGALAKPFNSHHNALDIDVYLRIAPETYLKRANAAGLNRVFEFAKCFRNEGISPQHLQEFTMLEYYGCYWNFRDNMAFTQKMLQAALERTFGKLSFTVPVDPAADEEQDEPATHTIDFGGEWPTYTFRDLILEHGDIDIFEHREVASLLEACKAKDIILDEEDAKSNNWGRIVDALYKVTARPKLIQPCFLTGHPVETSPLARRNDEDPSIVDRFHIVVLTAEIVNAYSELVDPVDQRERLVEQAALGEGGDKEAMDLDEDFLLCMEHGMPPISGTGIGIDRLLMVVMGLANIKDTVLFPLLRKSEGE